MVGGFEGGLHKGLLGNVVFCCCLINIRLLYYCYTSYTNHGFIGLSLSSLKNDYSDKPSKLLFNVAPIIHSPEYYTIRIIYEDSH